MKSNLRMVVSGMAVSLIILSGGVLNSVFAADNAVLNTESTNSTVLTATSKADKAAQKAQEEAEKAAQKAQEEAEKAAEKAQEEAEKAAENAAKDTVKEQNQTLAANWISMSAEQKEAVYALKDAEIDAQIEAVSSHVEAGYKTQAEADAIIAQLEALKTSIRESGQAPSFDNLVDLPAV